MTIERMLTMVWAFNHIDTNMSDMSEMTPVISRGMALHKMIRYVFLKMLQPMILTRFNAS